jgi:hypothetical protein
MKVARSLTVAARHPREKSAEASGDQYSRVRWRIWVEFQRMLHLFHTSSTARELEA